jgi:hypothetical protein
MADEHTNQHNHLPERTFDEAVNSVLNAPPTPEQQAKKAARKARAEERKRQKEGEKDERSS